MLVPLLADMFPYFTKHSYIQECYVNNLLNITLYLPTERAKILELIIDRLTKLDVCKTGVTDDILSHNAAN